MAQGDDFGAARQRETNRREAQRFDWESSILEREVAQNFNGSQSSEGVYEVPDSSQSQEEDAGALDPSTQDVPPAPSRVAQQHPRGRNLSGIQPRGTLAKHKRKGAPPTSEQQPPGKFLSSLDTPPAKKRSARSGRRTNRQKQGESKPVALLEPLGGNPEKFL